MAKRRRKKDRRRFSKKRRSRFDDRLRFHFDLSRETKKGIFTIGLFGLGALSLLGLFDLSGGFGQGIDKILSLALGTLKWLFPALCFLFGYFLLRQDKYEVKLINWIGAILLTLGLTAIWHLKFGAQDMRTAAENGFGGGYIGLILSAPLLANMSFWGALVVTLTVFLIGLLLTFEISLHGLMWPIKLFKFLTAHFQQLISVLREKRAGRDFQHEDSYEEEEEFNNDLEEDEEDDEIPTFKKSEVDNVEEIKEDESESVDINKPKKFGKKIDFSLDLLTSRSSKPTSGDIKNNQEIINKTLGNFGISVEMGEVNVGPTVTQYTLRPADGIKLSRIINLNSDLSLALATHPIRIEAPIPGKPLVGIEVPNQMAAKVTMHDLLNSKAFRKRSNDLYLALGKDVSGKPYFAQLDKMPHLLIAGATGSGKSVCINSLIISLLYQNSPDELKFIMVDPKRVELPSYNGIPYLLTPVITDVKKTINALKWTVVEMERRFDLLSRSGKRNITFYNRSSKDKLPYIVFIIDELADLMSTAASDVESGIVRLAQMARAVGIYLVLATQRPSVEVITGLIKANIPARIAFSVASLIDSRTILDSSGAEKLVGRGDMLFLGPDISKPKRLQGVFVSDKEIKDIVDFIKKQGGANYVDNVVEKQANGLLADGNASMGGNFGDEGDELLSEAKEVICEAGKASASLLQRRLKIGYARAARILDLLEDQGVIGPSDGAKPREVFLDRLAGDDYNEVDEMKFAAKEHGLEGELAGATEAQKLQSRLSVDIGRENNNEESEELEDEEPTVVFKNENEEDNIQKNKKVKKQKMKRAVLKEIKEAEAEEDGQVFNEDEWT